jgi:hypothetical protein
MIAKRKLFCVVLSLLLVFFIMPVTSYATTKNEPASVTRFSDMPNDWSTNALKGAVANGLLQGSDGKISPAANVTRAQMASVLVRAFGATVQADISASSDVPASSWYYADMAKAVQMNVIKGNSTGKLHPEDLLTRQEAFVMLARALKSNGGDTSVLSKFSDKDDISCWAVDDIASLIKDGYIQGSNGELDPLGAITRKELAQVMYNIIKTYINTEGTYTEVYSGNVMVNTKGITLENLTISGNLIIGDGVGNGKITLDNVRITGKMIVRGGGENSIIIKGGSAVSQVIVARIDGVVSVKVLDGADVEVIYIDDGSNDVNIQGKIGNLEINASDIVVSANEASINNLSIFGNNSKIVIDENTTVNKLNINEETSSINIELAGTVGTITSSAAGVNISGTGTLSQVIVQAGARDTSVTTRATNVITKIGSTNTVAGSKEVIPGTSTTIGGGKSISGGARRVTNAAMPIITTDLTDLTTPVGTAVTLDATATASDGGTITYQWYANDEANTDTPTLLTDETGATYTPAVDTVGISYYYCVITNTNNAAINNKTATTTSAVAKVTVVVNAATPIITTDLTDLTTPVGTAVTLDATATASDGGTITYQWYANDEANTLTPTLLTDETSATYAPAVDTGGVFYYYCVVTNTNDAATGSKTATTTSAVAKVTVLEDAAAPEITTDLTNIATPVGTAVTLDATATASDDGTITYQWYANDEANTLTPTLLTDETSATYAPAVDTGGVFYYFCVVTNTNDAATGNKTTTTTSAVAKVAVLTFNKEVTLSAPSVDGIPADSITATDQFTGTVTWNPNDGTFATGTEYTATIILSLSPGYDLTEVPENYFTVAGAVATNPAGSGVITAVFPTMVATAADLNNVRNDLTASYVQVANIDLENASWTPIANNSDFSGSYNGNGYTISNLNVSGTTSSGLFAEVSGQIENVKLESATVIGTSIVGGLVGYLSGTITNCEVIDCDVSGNCSVGGLAGHIYQGTVQGCSAAGTVSTAETEAYCESVGGLVGRNLGTIVKSFAAVNVSGKAYCTGGLVGNNGGGTIEKCYATGDVTGTAAWIGGLVGDNRKFIGEASIIRECYATGSVSGSSCGGLVGLNENGTIQRSYYNSETTGQIDTGKGIPETTANMMQQTTFVDWDFADTWTITEGTSYPFFK